MKKVVVLIAIGIVVFNCKAKKAAAAKNQKIESGTVQVKNPKTVAVPKVYANATERYIDTYSAIAKSEMKLYSIPASITLAQGILESGSGQGRLAVKANNHFGIKCHDWTGKKIYHDDDKKQECFRKYKDAKYSFRDHSLFLKDRQRYAKLFKLRIEDYEGWAKGLRAAGYATDKKYPQKLIALIERYKLYRFDKQTLGKSYRKAEKRLRNNSKQHTVTQGDTLYAISKKYNITVAELQKINGLKSTTISVGQQLKVKP